MIDERIIDILRDRFTGAELVDLLNINVEEIIDAFEPEVAAGLKDLDSFYNLGIDDLLESEDE